jgi:hypothetical protein
LGEKWPVNLACDSDFHVNRKDLIDAANLQHGTDGLIIPPKEGILWTFCPKNPTALAGFKPAMLGTRDQHANHYTTVAATCTGTKACLKNKCSYELRFIHVFIISNLLMFIAELTNYLQISPCRQFHFYVHVTMHR